MARPPKWLDYAVYPSDFHSRGVCWTFETVARARSKAISLGVGSWIRRYVNVIDKQTRKTQFRIDRLWLWNGVKFVCILEEPSSTKVKPSI